MSGENIIHFDGDARGRLQNYVPFHKTHEVPSEGTVTRDKGWKTNRPHHLLSRLEYHFFYNLEWYPKVIDIREQYVLDVEETIEIAKRLNVAHPAHTNKKKVRVISPMTTDFLVSVKKDIGVGEVARTVKYSQDLSDSRVIEKFEIERIYWESRGIDWGIVTEKDINLPLAKNIEIIHPYRRIELCEPITPEILVQLIPVLKNNLSKTNLTLADVCVACDVALNLAAGIALSAIWHLLATGKIKADMNTELEPRKKIKALEFQWTD